MSEPTCKKCGAPVTTGLMAMLCPGRKECEFWPEDLIEGGPLFEMYPDTWTPEEKQRFREHCAARSL